MVRHSVFEMITEIGVDRRRARPSVSTFRRIDRNTEDAIKGIKSRDDYPSAAFVGSQSDRPIR